jgi:hypothetical protein
MGFNKLIVAIAGGAALIEMLSGTVADSGAAVLASVTLAVKFAIPAVPVGVPVIAPVLAFRLKSAGNVPLSIEYVSVPAPPVTASAWLYGDPIVPAGNVVVVNVGTAVIAMFTTAFFVESATDVAVTVALPAAPLAAKVAALVVWFDRLPGPVWVQVTPSVPVSFVTVPVN